MAQQQQQQQSAGAAIPVIRSGDWVLIESSDHSIDRIVQVTAAAASATGNGGVEGDGGSFVKLSRIPVSTSVLVGLPFGSMFEVDLPNRRLIPIDPDSQDPRTQIVDVAGMTYDSDYDDDADKKGKGKVQGGVREGIERKRQGVEKRAVGGVETGLAADFIDAGGEREKRHQSYKHGVSVADTEMADAVVGGGAASSDRSTNHEDSSSSKTLAYAGSDSIDSITKANSMSVQKVKEGDIRDLRAAGKTGRDIIQELAKGSASFGKRTEFGKVKWLRKKQQKYLVVVTASRPTAAVMCRAYFEKKPAKICYMRWDALAQLLMRANIRYGGRPLVIDGCLGLVCGAVAERMLPVDLSLAKRSARPSKSQRRVMYLQAEAAAAAAAASTSSTAADSDGRADVAVPMRPEDKGLGRQLVQLPGAMRGPQGTLGDPASLDDPYGGGRMIVLHNKREQPLELFKCMNFPWQVSYEFMVKLGFYELPLFNLVASAQAKRAADPPVALSPEEEVAIAGEVEGTNDVRLEAMSFVSEGTDSLIIASPSDPWAVLRLAWPLLRLSAPFAIFHQFIEPLVEAADALRASGAALDVELEETLMREYQVLENRTHPMMRMKGASGFILSGVKIAEIGFGAALNARSGRDHARTAQATAERAFARKREEQDRQRQHQLAQSRIQKQQQQPQQQQHQHQPRSREQQSSIADGNSTGSNGAGSSSATARQRRGVQRQQQRPLAGAAAVAAVSATNSTETAIETDALASATELKRESEGPAEGDEPSKRARTTSHAH